MSSVLPAQVCFFLAVTTVALGECPRLVELPAAPPVSAGPQPMQVSPFSLDLGRSSRLLRGPLRNTLACPRELLKFTLWASRAPLAERADTDGTAPACAHTAAAHHGVRVWCSARNSLVYVRRFGASAGFLVLGREPGQAYLRDESGNPVTWLRVGDSLSIAGNVTLTLGAFKAVSVGPELGIAAHASATEQVCWFAGSDMSGDSRSGGGSASTTTNGAPHRPLPLSCSRDNNGCSPPLSAGTAAASSSSSPSPPLPQVGIRHPYTWQQLSQGTRQEKVLTCWSHWQSAVRDQARSRSPSGSTAPPVREATTAATTVDVGVQVDAPYGSGGAIINEAALAPLRHRPSDEGCGVAADSTADDLVLVKTAPPHSGPSSSRSSAMAGDDSGRPLLEVDAATPTASQLVESKSASGPGAARPPLVGVSRQRTTELSQQSNSLRLSPSTLLTARSRAQSTALGRPSHPSCGSGSGSREELCSGYTAGETYDANLDNALDELEQQQQQAMGTGPASPLPPLSGPGFAYGWPGSHCPALLGIEEEESSPVLASHSTVRASVNGQRGGSSTGTPKGSKSKRPGGGGSDAHVDRRSSSTASVGHPDRRRARTEREAGSWNSHLRQSGSGLTARQTHIGKASNRNNGPNTVNRNALEESQEVFFQH